MVTLTAARTFCIDFDIEPLLMGVGGASQDRHGQAPASVPPRTPSKEKARAGMETRPGFPLPSLPHESKKRKLQNKKTVSPQMDLQERTTKDWSAPSGASLFRPVPCSRWTKNRPIALKCPQVSPKTGSKFLKEPQNPAKKGVSGAGDRVKTS